MTMTTAYQFDIERTDKAGDLHQHQTDINEDPNLSPEEKAELSELIRVRFGLLTARARAQQAPRRPS